MTRQVIAILTDNLHGSEPVEQILANADQDGVELRVVIPATEANALHHTLGDIDEPRKEAEERLERALATLRKDGIEVRGEVGDPDPVQAAQDALLKAPADEVLIFETGDDEHPDHVVDVENTGQGTVNPIADKEIGDGVYVPGMTRSDFAGIVLGIVGTIIVAVQAAAVTADSAIGTGWEAAAILIAIGIALANLAHVVGISIFETVNYRGGFAKFFRTLALTGTPLAIVINTAILLFAGS